jgi:tripartite-type tricarboxylate transporter receptor subunit TctC
MFPNIPSVVNWIRLGSMRALGVTSLQRDPLLPEVAPISELGVPGYDMTNWFGLFLPAHAPAAIVARLNAEVRAIVQGADMKKRLLELGATPVDLTAEQFSEYVRKSNSEIGALIRTANLKPD